MLEDCYNVKYHIVCELGFSVGDEDVDYLIQKDKDNLKLFNQYMEQSHYLLKRLKMRNYKIAYFSVDHTYKGNDKVIATNIRIEKIYD